MLKIEAVTVCVDHHDFLAETALYNRHSIDRWIIVTTPEDMATRELCRKYSMECITTNEGKGEAGDEFNKGKMLNKAFHLLSADAWRLHIDADIALPHSFRKGVEYAQLHKHTIYGVDRILVRSWDDWQKLQATGYMHHQHDYHCRVNFPEGYDIGSRWASPSNGYVPIGFFQMWHSTEDQFSGIWVKQYPVNHNNACRTDVQHGLQWDRKNRALLPEVVVVHLESERAPLGANWNGRTTKMFAAPGVTNILKPTKYSGMMNDSKGGY